MDKRAKLDTELKPHQQRVVERMKRKDQPGLLVAHGLGSGKTLTSLAVQDALGLPAEAVVPASLQANYQKEIAKHHVGKKPPIAIQSMQNVATKRTPPTAPLMIVDEAHRLREPGSQTYHTLKKNEAAKRLLLTGSPFYNRPSDIAPLINVVAGDQVLPADRGEFEHRYISEKKISPGIIKTLLGVKPGSELVVNPRKQEELQQILNKWVDYHKGSTEGFPSVNREDVKVPMAKEQLHIYDTLLGRAPLWVRLKVKAGLPPSKAEAKELNAFLGGVRQVSNTTAPYVHEGTPVHPKIDKAFEELKKHLGSNERAKAVIYSNYLDAGIDPYKSLLQKENIPFGEFTGEMPKAKRDQLVRDYNENKLRTLFLSSAGGEGLDLKGTRLLQVLDPHWNEERLKQVEGRGVRYKSHEGLPPEEQNVLIQRYLATRPRAGILETLRLAKPGMGVDEYLTAMSANKERLNQQFRNMLEREPQQAKTSAVLDPLIAATAKMIASRPVQSMSVYNEASKIPDRLSRYEAALKAGIPLHLIQGQSVL